MKLDIAYNCCTRGIKWLSFRLVEELVSTGEVTEPQSRGQKIMSKLAMGRWLLLVALPGAVATFGGFAGLKTGQARINFILVTIFAALLLAFLNVWKDIQATRSARAAIATKALLAGALNQSGKPLVTLLGRIAESEGEARKANVHTLIPLTLQIAASQCGKLTKKKSKIRSVLYLFNASGQLARADWQGRQGKSPRPLFDVRNGKNDREVIEIAQGEDFVLCYDTEKDAPAYLDKVSDRPYRSYLQVPVRTDKRSFGFMSVDSDVPYALTSADVGYVILMARILASAFALLGGDVADLQHSKFAVPQQPKGVTDVETQT
jgi:hypothetical protein